MALKMTHFDEPEKRARKHWLICLIARAFLAIIGSMAYLLSATTLIPESSIFVFILTGAGVLFLNLLIPFYFAYRKLGTKYLSLCLIFGPLGMLISIFSVIKEPTIWSCANLVAGLPLYIWWYRLCWQLRKINGRIKLQKRTNDSAHLIAILQQSTNLETLDKEFSTLVRKWPHLEPLFSKEYEAKKSTLLLPQ